LRPSSALLSGDGRVGLFSASSGSGSSGASALSIFNVPGTTSSAAGVGSAGGEDAAEDESQNPKKKPKVDISLTLVSTMNKFEDELVDIKDSATDSLKAIKAALDSVPADDKDAYVKYMEMLQLRSTALMKWMGLKTDGGEESANATTLPEEEALACFEVFKADACKVGQERRLPCPDFVDVMCLVAIQKSGRELLNSSTSSEELKRNSKLATEMRMCARNLVACANKAVTELASARLARKKNLEQQICKAAKQASAQASAEAKKRALTTSQTKPP
jgi:hypothetical protein